MITIITIRYNLNIQLSGGLFLFSGFYHYIQVEVHFLNLFIERNPVILAQNLHRETSLPVLAYSGTGSVLSELGSAERDPGILNQLIRHMIETGKTDFHSMTLSDSVGNYYTASYVLHRQKNQGFLLIGPYSGNVQKVCEPAFCEFNQLFYDGLENGRSCSLPVCSKGLSPKLKSALNHILANYSNNLSIDEVSAFLGINKTYFCTLIKKELDMTFTGFLNLVRIEEAKQLLHSTDLSMLDIAVNVGYNNQNYFSIQFKKITGMTPGDYRRTNHISYE